MAHGQVRKRSRSRSSSSTSRSRQDMEKRKEKRKRSKDSQERRSPFPACKRGPESQELRMRSVSSKEGKKKKRDKKRRKASTSSSSDTTSSSGSSSSSEEEGSSGGEPKPKRKKKSKKKLAKEKKKKRKKKKAKKKASRKLKEREKEGKPRGEELPGPSLEQWQKETLVEPGPDGGGGPPLPAIATEACLSALTDEQKSRIQAMKPMTKEEWDARQSVIRRVVDPETGRTRLIKGDGEVLEEIVTKERHKEINKQATRGDGLSFQMKTGMLQ